MGNSIKVKFSTSGIWVESVYPLAPDVRLDLCAGNWSPDEEQHAALTRDAGLNAPLAADSLPECPVCVGQVCNLRQ